MVKIKLIMSMSSAFRKLVPMMNRVLVKKLEPVNQTKSGIIMSTKTEQPNVGEIVSVGKGNYSESGNLLPMELQQGQKVLLPEFGGMKVELSEGEFYLFRDTEILGVLEN